MQLSDAERQALVLLLSDRLPQWGSRATVARDAGLGDVQLAGSPRSVWGDLVDEACAADALPALLAAASRAAGGDAELAALADQAEAGALVVPEVVDTVSWVRGAAIAGAVVLVLGVVALGLDQVWGGAGEEAVVAVEPVAGDREPVAGDREPVAGDREPVAGDREPGVAEPEPVAVEPGGLEPEPVAAEPVGPSGPCADPRGEIVGYAYAGTDFPGGRGETWVVPRGLNVRADYPRKENRWNARTRVRCVLPRGASVRLEQAPVAVDGDAYWVPIVGGSVSSR